MVKREKEEKQGFRNDPFLRKAGQKISITKSQLNEIIRCKEDPIYFAEKYFKIVNLDEGKIIISLREYQKRMLKAFAYPPKGKKGVIVLSARQSGKTITSCIFLTWQALFNKDQVIAILANKESLAIELLRRVKMAIHELPLWLQQGIDDSFGWGKTQVGFENGTRIIAHSTSSSAIRGESINCCAGSTKIKLKKTNGLIIEIPIAELELSYYSANFHRYKVLTPSGWRRFDGLKRVMKGECYLIKLEDKKEIEITDEHLFKTNKGFVKAKNLKIGDELDTTNDYKKVVYCEKKEFVKIENYEGSNGLIEKRIKYVRHFYDLINVEGGSVYYTNDIVSHNCLYLDEFAFVPQYIADDFFKSVYPTIISGKNAKMIVSSTPNGLNGFYHLWRNAIRNENNFFPVKVHWSEIPGRDEKWKQQIIKDIGLKKFLQEFENQFLGSSDVLIDTRFLERIDIKEPVELKMKDSLMIYEHPQKGAMYILGVDSAKGIGKDYSVIQILKINSEHEVDQVAVYRNNNISPHDFAQVIISVSEFYNNAYLMVEQNSDDGGAVTNAIWYEYGCDRLLNFEKKGLGIRSNRHNKLAANLLLKRYVENGWLSICDRRTIYELSRYEEVKPNVFRAPIKENDDVVLALIWGLYFLTTTFFDGKNVDIKKIDKKFKLQPEAKEEDDQKEDFDVNDEPPIVVPEDDYYTDFFNERKNVRKENADVEEDEASGLVF